MRNRIQIALVLAGLLVLPGCASVGTYELKGEKILTLDQAIGQATCVQDLWTLWGQASADDKIIIEEEILNVSSKAQDLGTLQTLRRCTSNGDIRNAVANALREQEQAREEEAKRVREEEQIQAEKQVEEIRLARKESRQRLIREAGGRLNDKSAEEVKRLVDEWTGITRLIGEKWSDPQLFGTSDFYKAFGQPQRKQLISSHYYFYYGCRNGTVQMEVDANSLDKEGCIMVSDLNIF